jgi:hypothetical protein
MSSHPPYLILALPRSRTYWLSQFLSYADWACGHEEAIRMRGLDDVKSWLAQPSTGTVETCAAPYWRMLRHFCPGLRLITVRRPVEQVVESMLATGASPPREVLLRRMRRLDAKLDQIEHRVEGVLRVDYADLAGEATCAKLFQHCLPYEHNTAWWKHMQGVNLQINMAAMARYMQANIKQLFRLDSLCTQESRQQLHRAMPRETLDGITFQEQPMLSFLQEAEQLLAEHGLAVGEASNALWDKNLPLLYQLDSAGVLQIVTAKSNGRMLGYLVSALAPSVEDPTGERWTASQSFFFVSPDAPGIGLRLQRASLDGLRKRRPKWEILQRAGVRGAGERLSVLYRRMGAKPYGELFQFRLED